MKKSLRKALCLVGCLALIASVVTVLTATSASAAQPSDPGPANALPTTKPSAITPNVDDGRVFAIGKVGTTMIIGGSFTSVAGVPHQRVAAFNQSTGALINAFAPAANGDVNAVIPGPTANTVFIGGAFSQVNGIAKQFVALLNLTNGSLVTSFTAPAFNYGYVNDLVLRGSKLYVAGTFTAAGGLQHQGLVALNATTGALDASMNVQLTGHHNDTGSGAQAYVGATDFDVTADGKTMVVIGNFKFADGLLRDQVALIDLSGPTAVVSDWSTNRYSPYCFNWAFDQYVRGVAFSPDGSFFAINATGGGNPGTLCDSTARFEVTNNPDSQPTWVDENGGDTVWGITVTARAVYVGGHTRWMNNPYGTDNARAGAVPRAGMAALDVATGRPWAWNPGKIPLGVASFAYFATTDGVWMGYDQDYIGNRQYKRQKIAFFPYAGGYTPASTVTSELPGTVYLGGSQPGGNTNVLYRVNAGGPAVQSLDSGPDWTADDGTSSPYRNDGSNTGAYDSSETVDGTVPATTPSAIFETERWSPSDNPPMQWAFPVTAGRPIEVRLYFANRYGGTSQVGQRVFNVDLDGTRVLNNFDIVATTGDQRGTMKAFDITSDGTVNIDFSHVTENPLINGIEIVRTDITPTPTTNVMYRVNAGGPAVQSLDDGPNWAADDGTSSPYRNGGSNAAGWDGSETVDGTVPATTPRTIFESERWSPSDSPPMDWAFPVQAGLPIEVRLYFANRCGCTSGVGQRVFNVDLDGTRVLNNFDIVATTGDQRGTMKAFDITSDGTVNIDFSHVTENPLINGIEILRTDITPNPTAGDSLTTVAFDGTTATPATADNQGIDFGHWRGAFMVGGTVYYGYIDGYLYSRSYNGTTFGPAVKIDPYNDPAWSNITPYAGSPTLRGVVPNWYGQIPNVTGMTYYQGRVYYTLFGDSHLYSKWFLPDSSIIDETTATQSSSVDLSSADGMFASNGSMYYASRADGNLRRVDFSGGNLTGSATVVSGPSVDGVSWKNRALFLGAGAPANAAPTAAFTSHCTSLKCSFDGTGSSDSDGSVASYAWDFGDGNTGTGATPNHQYAGNGSYQVTLTVKDDKGKASAPVTHTLPVSNAVPTAAFTYTCSALACTFNGGSSSDSDGSIASYSWAFGDGGIATGATPSHTYGAADTYTVALTVTDDVGASSAPATKSVTVSTQVVGVQFVGAANAGGGNVKVKQVKIPTAATAGDTAVLSLAQSATTTWSGPTGVTGWTQVDAYTNSSLTTTVWVKPLSAGDVGATVRFDSSTYSHASADVAVYSGVSAATPVAAFAHSGDAGGTAHVTPTATAGAGDYVVSLWADRSSAPVTWSAPAGLVSRDASPDSGSTLAVQALIADANAASAGGQAGGLTATTDAATSRAAMWTIVLNAA